MKGGTCPGRGTAVNKIRGSGAPCSHEWEVDVAPDEVGMLRRRARAQRCDERQSRGACPTLHVTVPNGSQRTQQAS